MMAEEADSLVGPLVLWARWQPHRLRRNQLWTESSSPRKSFKLKCVNSGSLPFRLQGLCYRQACHTELCMDEYLLETHGESPTQMFTVPSCWGTKAFAYTRLLSRSPYSDPSLSHGPNTPRAQRVVEGKLFLFIDSWILFECPHTAISWYLCSSLRRSVAERNLECLNITRPHWPCYQNSLLTGERARHSSWEQVTNPHGRLSA